MIKIDPVGYGKADKAVASVLLQDERFELSWSARRSSNPTATKNPVPRVDQKTFPDGRKRHPLEAVADFADRDGTARVGHA
ncbi:MAG: hypothetical protein HYU74_00460 [Dechloromonas sp.]|nr:hypothetical protein [Dechloromonas sp.]